MDNNNKKLICAAAGAIGALAAVSATVFAVKQHKKKQNAILLEELDCYLDDDIAELANEAEETKAEESEAKEEPKAETEPEAEEKAEEPKAEPVAEEKAEEPEAKETEAPAETEE